VKSPESRRSILWILGAAVGAAISLIAVFAILRAGCEPPEEFRPWVSVRRSDYPYDTGLPPSLSMSVEHGSVYVFINSPPILQLILSNPSAEETLTLHGLPVRSGGEWEHGSVEIQGPGVQWRRSSHRNHLLEDPLLIPPQHVVNCVFSLGDYAEFTEPGRYTCTLEISLERGDGSIQMVQDSKSFDIAAEPLLAPGEMGAHLRALAVAIGSYQNWWGGQCPPVHSGVLSDSPLFPTALTTPEAYLSLRQTERCNGVVVVPGDTIFLAADRGPDGDWDIAPLLWTDGQFDWDNIASWAYDPTNGTESSGDLMVTSLDLVGHRARALERRERLDSWFHFEGLALANPEETH
jgi:hypothetical protein